MAAVYYLCAPADAAHRVFTTISTVGYGDFSPTTMLSRFFIVIFIVVGVIFFSVETGNLVALGERVASGKGSYILQADRRHVVLVGGACKARSESLEVFIKELLHDDNLADDLDLVILNPAASNDSIRSMLAEDYVGGRAMYLQGSIMITKDQERCKLKEASMAFVMADVATTFHAREDQDNIVRALAVKRYCAYHIHHSTHQPTHRPGQ